MFFSILGMLSFFFTFIITGGKKEKVDLVIFLIDFCFFVIIVGLSIFWELGTFRIIIINIKLKSGISNSFSLCHILAG